ncbi:peroxisomal membrane protein PEX13-like [Culicoides brevitarsis]|uniref:peroxisomal membrane protein PEX13-like n=1 Tax=Culicoides brevitarsis TaxID=469753 RepID=UPI00307CC16F
MEGAWANSDANNFRNPQIMDDTSRIFNRQGMQGLSRPSAPPVPPRPYGGNSMPYNAGYGASSYFGGGYGGFGGGYSPFGMSGMYGSGYGSRFGGFGGYGYSSMGGGDAENRFIQIAEESSRSAFQSIESVVNAVLNIAQMLESTYFALTSSFRAVLGVAANFGRLRGLFSQFWTSFALFRTFNWLIKKVLYMLRLSNIDPGSKALQEAYIAAQSGEMSPQKSSSLAVITFLGFITIGPYLLMKLLGTVSNTAIEETKNPKAWTNPIEAVAQYDFVASSPAELSVRCGQNVVVAPKSVQNVHKLLDSGWVLASTDGVTSGLVPVNYIESTKQAKLKEPVGMPSIPEEQQVTSNEEVKKDEL